MSIQILMPALFSTMKEGVLARWLCEKGDRITAGQPLAEIETDQGTVVLNADEEGRLIQILQDAGSAPIAVGSPIAMVDENDVETPKSFADALTDVSRVGAIPTNINVSPLARRVAEQAGIDLQKVKGSGPNGRIVLSDVEIYIAGRKADRVQQMAVASAPVAAVVGGASRNFMATPSTLSAPSVQGYASPQKVVPTAAIVASLTEPRALTTVCSVKTIVSLHELQSLQKTFERKEGRPLTTTACFIRALSLALRRMPALNVVALDGTVISNTHAHIGMSLPGISKRPVIHNADTKNLSQITDDEFELTKRAKAGELRVEEIQDPSLTLVDMTSYGVTEANLPPYPPQAALLVLCQAEEGRLTVVLSIDSRAIDPFAAAAFLSLVKAAIEQPFELVL